VKTLKKPGYHHDGGGLVLRIGKKTGRSWLYRYGIAGEDVWMGIGPASVDGGKDGKVTLAEARLRAAEQRRLRFAGKDPREERKRAKIAAQLARARGLSFRSAAEQYIDDHRGKWENPKHAAQWRSTLEQYAYPHVGDLPITEIDLPMVLKVLKQPVKAAKGKPEGPLWNARPETASRLRGRLESVLDWATVHKYRSAENPARWKGFLDHVLPARADVQRVKHHAALHYNEIGDFMAKLKAQDGVGADALEFTVLTAARTGEVIAEAFAIAQKYIQIGGAFLFPGGKRGKPLSNMAMTAVLRRMGCGEITVHGFRSAFRDWTAERSPYPHEMAEMALAHVIGNKVEAAYRRGDMIERRRQMMSDWAQWCSRPAPTGGNVVAIGRG
jgi:integrase